MFGLLLRLIYICACTVLYSFQSSIVRILFEVDRHLRNRAFAETAAKYYTQPSVVESSHSVEHQSHFYSLVDPNQAKWNIKISSFQPKIKYHKLVKMPNPTKSPFASLITASSSSVGSPNSPSCLTNSIRSFSTSTPGSNMSLCPLSGITVSS